MSDATSRASAGRPGGCAKWGCLTAVAVVLGLAILSSIFTMISRMRPALHEAVTAGDLERVEALLAQGASANEPGPEGTTPLCFATTKAIAQSLVAKGAIVTAVTDYGTTPLHFSAGRGNSEVVELLIERGAAVDATRPNGDTPLHWAVEGDRDPDEGLHGIEGPSDPRLLVETVRILLKHGANVNARDGGAATPLYRATGSLSPSLDVVRLLLDSGADAKAATSDRYTPLHNAAFHGEAEIARLLVERGADVNARGYFGDTPLHYSINSHSVELVKMLLDHGANVNARNNQGQTPLSRVFRPKPGSNMAPTPPEIERVLKEYGGTN